jgi:mRNA-degrading endonuclease RelE of RelBE toxin-antitoxin system
LKIGFDKRFEKDFDRLDAKIQAWVKENIKLLIAADKLSSIPSISTNGWPKRNACYT